MSFIELSSLPSKEVIKGYHGKAIHTGSMTLMFWIVNSGESMPIHQHHHEQVAQVLKGEFELEVAGVKRVLRPGIVAIIPPDTPHGGMAITDCELLDIFLPERDDYRFSEEAAG